LPLALAVTATRLTGARRLVGRGNPRAGGADDTEAGETADDDGEDDRNE
jgi:hypothetical protein